MKNLILMTFLAIFIAATSFGHNGPEHKTTYGIDSEQSTVTWVGKKVTGEHTGTISIEKGTILMDHGKLHSVSIVMDMTTISCTDIEDEGYNKKLVGHLASDDFFSVESHPKAQFTSKSFNKNNDEFVITGDLVIKGISHEVSFPVSMEEKEGFLFANGKITFDRTKYNVKYGSGKFFDSLGDKMIYDDVSLKFSIVASELN